MWGLMFSTSALAKPTVPVPRSLASDPRATPTKAEDEVGVVRGNRAGADVRGRDAGRVSAQAARCAGREYRSARPSAQAVKALLASPWFALGMGASGLAWVLHLAALAVAPLSMVQAVLASGVIILALLGRFLFGWSISRRQWYGIALTASALCVLKRRERFLMHFPQIDVSGKRPLASAPVCSRRSRWSRLGRLITSWWRTSTGSSDR
jgi:multidrug transporter EmrE-like cation transporter